MDTLRDRILRALVDHYHGDAKRAQATFDAIDMVLSAWIRERISDLRAAKRSRP